MATINELVAGFDREVEAAKDKRDRCRRDGKMILEAVRAEGRGSLNPDETARYYALRDAGEAAQAEVKSAEAKLADAKQIHAEEAESDRLAAETHPTGSRGNSGERTVNANDGRMLYGSGTTERSGFTRERDGKEAVLPRGVSLRDSDVARDEMKRNSERDRIITGTYGGLAQQLRAVSTTSGMSAAVPTVWATDVIDRARNASVAFQAGASLVPMSAKVEQLARLTTDPSPAFKTEGSPVTPSDPAFDNVTLTATSLASLTVASVEVLQDAPNADQLVMNAIAASMALQLDLVAFFGQLGATGTNDEGASYALASPNPRGILKALLTDASAQVLGFATNGTAQTASPGNQYQELTNLYYQVKRQNENPTAVVSNDALVQQYQGLVNTLGEVLDVPAPMAGMPWYTTNMISSYTRGTMTNVATDVFMGDFSQLLIGQRMGLEVRVLTERYAENGQVGFLAYWRGDVQLARPKAFACYRALKGSV